MFSSSPSVQMIESHFFPSLFEQVWMTSEADNESGNLIAYVLLSSVMMTINISNGVCLFSLNHADRKYGAEPIYNPM